MDRKSKLDRLSKLKQENLESKYGSKSQNYTGQDDNFIVDDTETDLKEISKVRKRGKRNEYFEEDEEYFKRLSMKDRDPPRRKTFKDIQEVTQFQKPTKKVNQSEAQESKALMDDIFDQLDEIDDDNKVLAEVRDLEFREKEEEERKYMQMKEKLRIVEEVNGKMVEENISKEKQSEEIDLAELDAFTKEFHETEKKKQRSNQKRNKNYKPPKSGLKVERYSSSMGIGRNNQFYFNRINQSKGIEFKSKGMEIETNEILPFDIEIKDDDGEFTSITPFYWLDILENRKSKNMITFIGKVLDKESKELKSASLHVSLNFRHLYFCKKSNADFEDFEREVKSVMEKYLKFASNNKKDLDKVTYERTTKRYAFELNIEVDDQLEVECIEVKVPFRIPMPTSFREDHNQSNYLFRHEGEFYKGVIGFTHTAVELAQLNLKLKGPSWFAIEEPEIVKQKKKTTWCDVELNVSELDEIVRLDKAEIPEKNPKVKTVYLSFSKENSEDRVEKEIDCITILEYDADCNFCEENPKVTPYFLAVNPFKSTNPSEQAEIKQKMKQKFGKNYEIYHTEFAALKAFLDKIQSIDPDIIIGHEIGSKLGILFDRIKHYTRGSGIKSLGKFSALSRFKKDPKQFSKTNTKNKMFFVKNITSGRLYLDSYQVANEFMKEVDYSLEYLSSKYFKMNFSKIIKLDNLNAFETHAKKIDICFQESYLSLLVVKKLQAIQLTKQLTNVAGCLWSLSLGNQRAKRNEMLLMHRFIKEGYLLPDYIRLEHTQKSKKEFKEKVPKFEGGKVFAPNKGIHHAFTVLLDFNSLYPSIIRQYKLCFTTVKRTKYDLDFYFDPKKRIEYEIAMRKPRELTAEHNPQDVESEETFKNLLPRIVGTLIEKRKIVKKKMKAEDHPAKKNTMDIKQKALKLIANSIYGCLGFPHSRFYSKVIASMVTYYGRSLIEKSANRVNELGFEVIYGDTDSVMINSRKNSLLDALTVAIDLKKQINLLFKEKGKKSILEVDIDGVFKSFLIHSKKKYAAMMLDNFDQVVKNMGKLANGDIDAEYKLEIKGLDFVRRDWCNLTKKTGKELLKIMLGKVDHDDIIGDVYSYLETLGNKLKNHKIALKDFIIYKVLKKDPKDYKNLYSQPHAFVADRLIKSKKRTLQQLLNHSIGFIVCKAENENVTSAGARAFHIEEVQENGYSPDYTYYAENQISNPIHRIIQYLDGIDPDRVAKAIGINAMKLRNSSAGKDNDLTGKVNFFKSRLPQNYKYVKWCSPAFNKEKAKFSGKKVLYDPSKPFTCNSHPKPYSLNSTEVKHLLIKIIRERVKEYYKFEQACEECSNSIDCLSFVQECEDCGHDESHFRYNSLDLNADVKSFSEILENLKKKKNLKLENLNEENIQKILHYLSDFFGKRSKFNTIDLTDASVCFNQLKKPVRKTRNLRKMYTLANFGQVKI